MAPRSSYAIMLVLLSLIVSADALASACGASQQGRPKIGLVLGGGGARGAAHIGVIKKLEELRVPVDFISGTSMGSIVGGLHAAGMSGEELEELVISIDWPDLFEDETRRADQPFRRKRDDDLSLIDPKLGVGKGSTLLPQGAVGGQKIAFFFSSVANQHVQTRDFDQLPIPYRAIAADVVTGEQVVLAEGDLGLAMRSSMSIPGVFAPVEHGQHLLVDGGIVNNIPIDVVREMGADIVIAVDVGTPLIAREALTDLVAVTAQLSGFLVVSNSREQLATLGTEDFHLQPKLGSRISSSDFELVDQAIPLGYEAADAVSDQLAALAIEPEAYARYRQQLRQCQAGLPTVQFVDIDNRSRYSDAVLEEHIHTRMGEPLDMVQLEKDVAQIYALGYLETARYELIEKDGETGVVFHVEQDKRGTGFIEWGFDLFADDDSSDINVRLGYLKTDLDELGSEFRGLVQLGEDPGFLAELYKPIDRRLQYVFMPNLFAERREVVQFDDDGNRLNEFQVEQYGGSLMFAREIERHAAIAAGLRYEAGEVKVEIGDPMFDDFNYKSAAYVVQVHYDRVDDSFFPSTGSTLKIRYSNYSEDLGSDDEFEQVRASGYTAFTFDRHTLLAGGSYDTTLDDDAPVQNLFRAGGFTRLSGLSENEISGQHFGMLFGSYRYKFSESTLLPGYLGATLEYGNAVDDSGDIFDEGILNGSLYMGYRSPVGPIYIGFGLAEGGDGNFFMRIGNVFSRAAIGR